MRWRLKMSVTATCWPAIPQAQRRPVERAGAGTGADCLQDGGFIPKPARHTANKRLCPTAGSHIRVNEIAKIRAIWCEMARLGIVRDGSETALNHWVQRMTARLNGGVGVAAGVASEFGKILR